MPFAKLTNISRLPVHLFLFPVYFVCSKYVQYQGLPPISTTVSSCLFILLGALAVFFLLDLLLKNKIRSAVISTILTAGFLLFGEMHVYLKETAGISFISKYKFFLPLVILLFFLFYKLIKQEPFLNKVNSFLNLLVLIYLLFEIFLIARIPSGYQASKKNEPAIPVTQNDLPDIYYIVPDCYPSASYQQEVLHFNNTAFEDSLKKAGFFLPKESSSNYNRTAFSMLSVFNMDYVKGVDTLRKVDAKNYALALHQLRSARVFTLLDEADYKLINLSIFDILNTKALLKQDFLAASPEEFFFSYSFAHYFLRDIYYTWLSRKSKLQKTNLAEKYEPVKAYNRLVIDTLLQHNFTSPAKPVFVYAHLNMPHYPYFFNATGEPFEQDSIYGKEMITSRDRFTAYIQYTNKQLLNIADAIRKKTNGKAVIIIQSDHGLYDLDEKRKADAFKNFTAVYFPDKNYASVPDTLSNVNSFRLVLNRYLQQKLPLIENKSYFISIR